MAVVVLALAVLWYVGAFERDDPTEQRVADEPVVPPPPPAPESAAQRFARASEAIRAGNPDAAAGLLHQLETEGHGPTLLLLAEAIDSIDFTPGLYTAPNDIAAIQFYARACAGPERQAALSGLQRLGTALRARANEGDAVAEQLVTMQVPDAMAKCR